MKSDLIKRLEAMEKHLGADENQPTIWISRPNDNNEHPPAAGWTEAMCSNPITVMRLPEESDERLQARALAAFRAKPDRHPMSAAVFISVHSSV
jgi:hypothetical protein